MHSQPALTSNSLSTSNSSISTITLPASSSEAKMQYNDGTADIAHRYITTCNAQSTSIDIEFTIDIEFIDFSTITLPASSSEAKMQYNDGTADIAHRYITTCNAQSTSIDIEFTIDIE